MLHVFSTVAMIDNVASETLAKVEEKFPIINKTPSEVGNKHVTVFIYLLCKTFSCLYVLRSRVLAKLTNKKKLNFPIHAAK